LAANAKSGVLSARILGCGSSGGVPRIGGEDGAGDWGACDPNEPRNRRSRCSLLVERGDGDGGEKTSLLIDTSPDMRAQLLDARCKRLDAVLYTHHHADQCHGIDDLRVFALAQRARIPVYIDEETGGEILTRFDYCFVQPPGSYYAPILDHRVMPACGETFEIEGPGGAIKVTPFLQYHGGLNSLGFRMGDIAYSSDVVGLPEESFEVLAGVRTWIVDALQVKPHVTHAHLDLTLEWIARVRPERAILTNLHVTMDYQTLKKSLPAGVEPAYDGMIVSGSI
jgi:phosphoribosyl 1,2-cyclic phosphate phosphodiesterase